jgi:hypothetical protein
VARTAPTAAVEVSLARFRIAHQHVEDLVGAAVRREIDRRVQECREIGDLRRSQFELGHAAIGPADAQKLAELFAVLVALDQLRPRQVGTARSASRVRAMTEPALLGHQLLTAFDRSGVEQWRLRLRVNHRGQETERRRDDNDTNHVRVTSLRKAVARCGPEMS